MSEWHQRKILNSFKQRFTYTKCNNNNNKKTKAIDHTCSSM